METKNIMRPTFEQTVDVLVKAYLNDTLIHGNCSACVVGNLCAHAIGTRVIETDPQLRSSILWSHMRFNWAKGDPRWHNVFITSPYTGQRRSESMYYGVAKQQIDATGYTWQELARIEYAFETAPKGKDDDEWMFNGLMSVLDVLADIHGVDLEKVESAKALFVKA